MEVQNIPNSVQRLFEEAQASVDAAVLLQSRGSNGEARAKAQLAITLLAQAADQVSGKKQEFEVLLELHQRGKRGYKRTETKAEREVHPPSATNQRCRELERY